MDDDDGVPLSQLANEAFSTVLPHTTKPGTARGPTDFSGLGAAFTTGGGGAALVASGVASGAGPGSTAAANGTGPGPGSDAAANGTGPGPGSDAAANGAGPGPGSNAAAAAGARRPKVHGKLFQDPVHDAYRLDPLCALIFDTRQFQRLRNLKQLGLTYHVYVGASHNRFEHSLGVAHLADRFANHLWRLQQGDTEVERRDLKLVQIAGLCHDLGHGPFSHVFEREFLRRKGITTWEHEHMSSAMLDFIVDENHIDALSRADITRVQNMITSGHGNMAPAGQRWLYEIVANGRNNIDVDKFDYLMRDSHHCGVKTACNFNRIMQFSKVIDDEICFKYTEYRNLYELFHARAAMHRAVYTHKKVTAVDQMVTDALLEADPALRISEKIHDPADFQLLDDSLLNMIENFEMFRGMLNLAPEDDAAMKSSQAIIARLRRRDLYKYVSDALIPPEDLERDRWVAPTPQDIVNSYRGSGVRLRAEDIILHENKIDYSARNKNPLDEVHFFDNLDATDKRKLRPDQISSMVVAHHQERSLRLYSRNSSPQHVQAAHEAFDSWCRGRFGSKVITSTPCKPPRPPPPQPAANAPAAGVDAVGGKRARGLFVGDDESSPSNLVQAKMARQ